MIPCVEQCRGQGMRGLARRVWNEKRKRLTPILYIGVPFKSIYIWHRPWLTVIFFLISWGVCEVWYTHVSMYVPIWNPNCSLPIKKKIKRGHPHLLPPAQKPSIATSTQRAIPWLEFHYLDHIWRFSVHMYEYYLIHLVSKLIGQLAWENRWIIAGLMKTQIM